jgi:hypothetical protein
VAGAVILIAFLAGLFLFIDPMKDSGTGSINKTIANTDTKEQAARTDRSRKENTEHYSSSDLPADKANDGKKGRNQAIQVLPDLKGIHTPKPVPHPAILPGDNTMANYAITGPQTQNDNPSPTVNEQIITRIESQTHFLDSFVEMSLDPYRNAGNNPLAQDSRKKKTGGVRSETGITAGFLWTIPAYPAASAYSIPKAGFKAGLYREQRLTNRLSLLADPSVVYRWGTVLEKSSIKSRTFLKREVIETRVTTHGILSLDVPVSLVVNAGDRHAFTAGVYGSFLLNTLSDISETGQNGNTGPNPQRNVWNYKAGFRQTAYGLSAGYIYRRNTRISFTGVYTFLFSDIADEAYYDTDLSPISSLQVGMRYKIIGK